jgi:hypothetical protein
MRHAFRLLLSLACGACGAGVPTVDSRTTHDSVAVAEVRAAMVRFAERMTDSGTIAWLDAINTDSLVWMSDGVYLPQGPAFVAAMQDAARQFPRVRMRFDSIRVLPHAANIASATATYREIVFTPAGDSLQVAGAFLGIWRRDPPGWRLVAGHTSHAGPPK